MSILTIVYLDIALDFFFFIIICYFKFYLNKNSTGVLCGVLGTCMHRQGRGELAPFDPKIERTISRLQREIRVLVVHNRYCNTPKYTLAVFDMFRVFCKHNLKVS